MGRLSPILTSPRAWDVHLPPQSTKTLKGREISLQRALPCILCFNTLIAGEDPAKDQAGHCSSSKPSENRRASNWTEAGNGSVYPLHIRCEASGFALLLKWTEVMAVVPVLVCLCLWGLKTCDSNFSKFRPPIVFIFCILYIGGNGVTCSSSV